MVKRRIRKWKQNKKLKEKRSFAKIKRQTEKKKDNSEKKEEKCGNKNKKAKIR